MRSIHNQFFDDIEIIFVDDYSKDNSIKKIENCQNEDERIILINLMMEQILIKQLKS